MPDSTQQGHTVTWRRFRTSLVQNRFLDQIIQNHGPNGVQYTKKVIQPKVEEVVTVYKVTAINKKQALLTTRGNTNVAIVPLSAELINALNINKKAYVMAAFVKHELIIKGLAPIQEW